MQKFSDEQCHVPLINFKAINYVSKGVPLLLWQLLHSISKIAIPIPLQLYKTAI